jgi:hypothetical protein
MFFSNIPGPFQTYQVYLKHIRSIWNIPVPEFIDLVFAKTSPKRSYLVIESERCSYLVIESERCGLVFVKNWVYKFGHRPVSNIPGPSQTYQIRLKHTRSVSNIPDPSHIYQVRSKHTRSVSNISGPFETYHDTRPVSKIPGPFQTYQCPNL